MTTVEHLIGDLLLRHNCVIVPSFGGFVAKQVSAKIDYASGRMTPPSKSLLFNKQLINNDGLLINEFSQANELSFNQASKEVSAKVSLWREALKSGQRIELDRVGYLYNDAENNLCFEQDRFFNLLLESYGLGKVHFLSEEDVQIAERINVQRELASAIVVEEKAALAKAVEETENNKQEVPVIAHPTIQKKRKFKAWRYIAAACILPIAFYSIWIPMKTDVLESGMLSFKDFNPFHKTVKAQYKKNGIRFNSNTEQSRLSLEQKVSELPEEVQVYTYKYDDELYIPVALDKFEVRTKTERIPNELLEVNAMHLVVGCFGEESNAINLVAKLKSKGLNASIVDLHNGLHRVSAGSAFSMEAIYKLREEVSALGYSAWTLK